MKHITSLLVIIFIPVFCFAATDGDASINFKHQLLSIINYLLLIVSLISIRQFFWPREKNNTLFQAFNMIFTITFYIVSILFIIGHKAYYDGFENLTDAGCVQKFFFDYNLSMVLQGIVIFSFFINILYVIKYGRRFYLDIA